MDRELHHTQCEEKESNEQSIQTEERQEEHPHTQQEENNVPQTGDGNKFNPQEEYDKNNYQYPSEQYPSEQYQSEQYQSEQYPSEEQYDHQYNENDVQVYDYDTYEEAHSDLKGEDDGSDDDSPPAPNSSEFQVVSGYENINSIDQEVGIKPPVAVPAAPTGKAPHEHFDDVANLKEEECREAMLQFVAERCCFGSGPAKKMAIGAIKPSTALHYILETFCEGRSTSRAHEPFHGQPIDGPENGAPPPPWTIPCEALKQFDTHVRYLEVPHTAEVKCCWRCGGSGQIRCSRCSGRGQVRCGSCSGRGNRRVHTKNGWETRRCHSCGGDGRRRCGRCGGDGLVRCHMCQGHGRLKVFIKLTVTFTNHESDFILEKTDMPDELVRQVTGTVIYEQTNLPVWPISTYPVNEINMNSNKLTSDHRTGFPSERQLNQRQTLRAVPVTEVDYNYKDLNTRYWVYGRERQVYSPDYPAQCCWGCEIL